MAIEQSIYTCVLKRRDNGKTGFGYYSFTSGFEKICSENPLIKKVSVSYASPRNQELWWSYEDDDEIRDREEAENINIHHPISFSYMPVDLNGTKKAIFTFGKNLGRDIMKSRPGNILINTLIADMNDISGYPFSYYGSPELFVDYDVNYFYENGKEIPPVLENPDKISKNERFTINDICRFIRKNDRIEYLYSMFQILLDYNDARKPTRQIMICDKKDNIIYWISALSVLLPVELANKFSFTTYSFLASRPDDITPAYEDVMLCGVYSPYINGDETDERATNYSFSTESAREDVALFDFEHNFFPDTEIENSEFEMLIESAFTSDIAQLKDYHRFLIEKTSYRSLDDDYMLGYSFYLIYNYPDIDNFRCMENAREFIIKYADKSCIDEILENLMSETVDKGKVGSECEKILDFLEISYKDKSTSEKIAVCNRYLDYLKSILYSENANKNEYAENREKIKNFCKNIGLSYHEQFNRVLANDDILDICRKTNKKWILTELADIIINRINRQINNTELDRIFRTILTRILSDKKNRIQLFSHYINSLKYVHYQVALLDSVFANADNEFKHEIMKFATEKLISAEDNTFLSALSETELYNKIMENTFSIIERSEMVTFRKLCDLFKKFLCYDSPYNEKALECMLDKMVFADTTEEEMSNIYETFKFARINGLLDKKTAINLAVAYKEDVFKLENWYDLSKDKFNHLEEILMSVGISMQNIEKTENVCNLYVIHNINNCLSSDTNSAFMDTNNTAVDFSTLSAIEKTKFIERISEYLYKCSIVNNTAFLNFQNIIQLPTERRASSPCCKIMNEWLLHLIEENSKKHNIIAELVLIMSFYCKVNYNIISSDFIKNNIRFNSIISYYESNNDSLCREINRKYGLKISGEFVKKTSESLVSAYHIEKPASPMQKFKSTFDKWRKN